MTHWNIKLMKQKLNAFISTTKD